MQKSLSVLVLFSCIVFSNSFNSNGILGYINVPSAYNLTSSEYAIILERNNPDRRLVVTASPFDWLDANFFYVDITGKEYGNVFSQSYKDKGFNFKISPFRLFDHQIAIGFNDIAGTNFFQSEYIVASNYLSNFEYTIGLGWGSFDSGFDFQNPLIRLNDKFRNRSQRFTDRGGNFDFNDYFSGNKASLFFGSSYNLNNNLKLLIEYDPTNVNVDIPYSKVKTRLNAGVQFRYKNFIVKGSIVRGSSFNFQLTYSEDLKKFSYISQKNPKERVDSFQKLQKILSENQIGLKEIESSEDSVLFHVRNNAYFNHDRVNDIVLSNSSNLIQFSDANEIIIAHYIHGMQVAENNFSNTLGQYPIEEKSSENVTYKKLYTVIEPYPLISNTIAPVLRNYVAAREGFYFGGVFLEDDLEIIFDENLFLIGNFKYSIWDDFDNLIYPPLDKYLEQVRSDNKKYYNNFDNGITVGRLELNYFESYKNQHFFRGSVGIFEEMFGGVGFDYLYSPERSIFSAGVEIYSVKKRDYDMRFNFRKYKNSMARVNFQLIEPNTNVRIKYSYGEYLAGDIGYTLKFTRAFENGIEFSTFFTRTNVPKNLYGEGSFDKGVSMTIPISSLFNNRKSLSKYVWRPLTKDPGAMLNKSIEIYDEVNRFRYFH